MSIKCKFCHQPLTDSDYVSVPACIKCVTANTKPQTKDMSRAEKIKYMRANGLWKR